MSVLASRIRRFLRRSRLPRRAAALISRIATLLGRIFKRAIALTSMGWALLGRIFERAAALVLRIWTPIDRRFHVSGRLRALVLSIWTPIDRRFRISERVRALQPRFRALLASRFRLSAQLYFGIGGAVFLTVAASLVSWFSFNSVGNAQSQVNESSVPEIVAAFGVAQHSTTLVAAAPRLAAAVDQDELSAVSNSVSEARAALEAQLEVLGVEVEVEIQQSSIFGQVGQVFDEGRQVISRQVIERPVDLLTQAPVVGGVVEDVLPLGDDDLDEEQRRAAEKERSDRIRARVDTLILNTHDIENDMSELFELKWRREILQQRLSELRADLDRILVPAVDDQFFYAMTGYRDPGAPPAKRGEHFSETEFGIYRHMAELQANATAATQILESAFAISDAPLIEPLRERFESAAGRIERNLSNLGSSPLRAEVEPFINQLFGLGTGREDGFDLLEQELQIIERQQALLASNRDIAANLVTEVDSLVSAARASAQDATRASAQAIFAGRTLLLMIGALTIGSALTIAWFFVRVLLRRLQMLSNWMRHMAGGDLETQVEIGGRDEVAEMASALEIFRRHALEVQRLNLVEKLAEEVQGKNDQLESALSDLRTAQDQIVMREKLAALGELTAGVAHEIRNPLNFIKNFSEVSEELLVEMKEVIVEVGEKIDQDQKGLIDDISQDLTDNLERIRSHGDRANRIVHDMLMMGRGSSEFQATEINSLLDEYARLAYHSARATDPNFQLDIQQDLDPDAGEIEVIPQDMGRVFLNMVGNACDATDEKRQASEAAETQPGAQRYAPTIWLATRRGGDQVEIRIRDNGNGIPPHVIEDIFNPFFTTKPTGQGTGLGLAMSSDIVREHGGSIRVESEPGEFTEMIVELPLEPQAAIAAREEGNEPGE